jgi:hypothetical protein
MSGQFLEVVGEGGTMFQASVLNPVDAVAKIINNIGEAIHDLKDGKIDEMTALRRFDTAHQQLSALHGMLLESAWEVMSQDLSEASVRQMAADTEMREQMENDSAKQIRLMSVLMELATPDESLTDEQREQLEAIRKIQEEFGGEE